MARTHSHTLPIIGRKLKKNQLKFGKAARTLMNNGLSYEKAKQRLTQYVVS